jgi:hypothetical protein
MTIADMIETKHTPPPTKGAILARHIKKIIIRVFDLCIYQPPRSTKKTQ